MPYGTAHSACARMLRHGFFSDTAGAVLARLSAFTDPYLGQTLGEAKAIVSVSLEGELARIALKFGFPCADYGRGARRPRCSR